MLVWIADSRLSDELAAELGVTFDYLEHLVWGNTQRLRAQLRELSETELWEYVRGELQIVPEEYPDQRVCFYREMGSTPNWSPYAP